MMTDKFYTDEKNAQIVIALLKAHGIRRIVANPGTTNIAIVGSVQNDPWFQVYSGVDERHSAYMAVGMAAESGEPVVLSCTGATASRNYLPALTEAYYRKLPILALTSIHHMNSVGNLLPQMLDRSVAQKDVCRFSLQCPVPITQRQIDDCVSNVNKAILELTRHGGGPVHINLETERGFTFNTKVLPDFRVIRRVTPFCREFPMIEFAQKIAVMIGAHKQFSSDEINAISRFVRSRNAVVLVDRTSHYNGDGAVLSALFCQQDGASVNPKHKQLIPDLIIQIGEISGDYASMWVGRCAKSVWRVSEDGEARDLFNSLTYVFEMPEKVFFEHYTTGEEKELSYADQWRETLRSLRTNLPELPYSNIWMASKICDRLPSGSELQVGILNSLRTWNMFDLPSDVTSDCNVGGFGIDGALSTLIGASLASPSRLFFAVVGDLAFFYDLNSLGNRYIGKNLRILLVNNGCGGEFNLYTHPGHQFGEQVKDYIAAGNHFGKRSRNLVRHLATDLGFRYLSASNKEEFLSACAQYLDPSVEDSIVFECFVDPDDDSEALRAMKMIDPYSDSEGGHSLFGGIKRHIPQRVKNVIRAAVQ